MNKFINTGMVSMNFCSGFIIFLMLMMTGHSAFADCATNRGGASPMTITIPQPVIAVQRDVPVGTIIETITTTTPQFAFSSCNMSGSIFYKMGMFSEPSGIAHVYKTNVPGVGISILQPSLAGVDYWYENPPGVRSIVQSSSVNVTRFIISLVKIGNIEPGSISSGVVGTIYADDGVTTVTVNFVGGQVSQLACSVNTRTLTFPIGDIPVSSFGETAGTMPENAQSVQNLGLSCDAGANINVILNGAQNPDVPGITSVLALTGQGNNSVAKGVGVQLFYNGSPLLLNASILLKTSSGGQEMLPLTARYYQTKNQVTTGDASTTATLQLTYQ